jgi:hypothetical protein
MNISSIEIKLAGLNKKRVLLLNFDNACFQDLDTNTLFKNHLKLAKTV